MKITWNGHACFTLECENGTIVFDPFENGSVPGLRDLKLEAHTVLCSHEHYDHNARHTVTLKPENTSFTIKTIDSYHDDKEGSLRGKNIIHIIETEQQKVVHLGDLGHMISHDELKNCDVLMVPVGGHYTIDAKVAKAVIDALNPRIVIPMHYRTEAFGFDVISHLNAFTDLYDQVVYHPTNNIEVTQDTPKQIVVLNY